MTKKGHDYLFVIVDRFSKMYVLIPCKKTITTQDATNFFFSHVWVHLGLPSSIVSNKDRFLDKFWTCSWKKMDKILKKSIAFHP